MLDDLDHPWDVVIAADGTLLTGERGGRFVALLPTGERRELRADLGDLFARGETGLMGLALPSPRKAGSCSAVRASRTAGRTTCELCPGPSTHNGQN